MKVIGGLFTWWFLQGRGRWFLVYGLFTLCLSSHSTQLSWILQILHSFQSRIWKLKLLINELPFLVLSFFHPTGTLQTLDKPLKLLLLLFVYFWHSALFDKTLPICLHFLSFLLCYHFLSLNHIGIGLVLMVSGFGVLVIRIVALLVSVIILFWLPIFLKILFIELNHSAVLFHFSCPDSLILGFPL